MAENCFLYYITDRRALPGDESNRRRLLFEKIAEAARAGVDYIQLREKDLPIRELEQLALQAASVIAKEKRQATDHCSTITALLINSRADVALAVGTAGVHLRSDDISPQDVRRVWSRTSSQPPVIGVSCHSYEDAFKAEMNGADFAVFAPVFEKRDDPGIQPAGLERLRETCAAKIPVLALGGVTLENARLCLGAGAKGIAGIRLFQENDVARIVRELCG